MTRFIAAIKFRGKTSPGLLELFKSALNTDAQMNGLSLYTLKEDGPVFVIRITHSDEMCDIRLAMNVIKSALDSIVDSILIIDCLRIWENYGSLKTGPSISELSSVLKDIISDNLPH